MVRSVLAGTTLTRYQTIAKDALQNVSLVPPQQFASLAFSDFHFKEVTVLRNAAMASEKILRNVMI